MWRVELKQGASWELGQKSRCPESHVPPLFLEDGNEISPRRKKKMAEKKLISISVVLTCDYNPRNMAAECRFRRKKYLKK